MTLAATTSLSLSRAPANFETVNTVLTLSSLLKASVTIPVKRLAPLCSDFEGLFHIQ